MVVVDKTGRTGTINVCCIGSFAAGVAVIEEVQKASSGWWHLISIGCAGTIIICCSGSHSGRRRSCRVIVSSPKGFRVFWLVVVDPIGCAGTTIACSAAVAGARVAVIELVQRFLEVGCSYSNWLCRHHKCLLQCQSQQQEL